MNCDMSVLYMCHIVCVACMVICLYYICVILCVARFVMCLYYICVILCVACIVMCLYYILGQKRNATYKLKTLCVK